MEGSKGEEFWKSIWITDGINRRYYSPFVSKVVKGIFRLRENVKYSVLVTVSYTDSFIYVLI